MYKKANVGGLSMPIERIFVRALIVLAGISVILVLAFCPPSYVVPVIMFLFICVAAEFALPVTPASETKKVSKAVINAVIILLGIGVNNRTASGGEG